MSEAPLHTELRRRTPLVALVGRPNVGKSTLFNKLVGKRVALVDDQPGVTRDRLFGEARHEGKLLRIVDTGGLDARTDDTVMSGVREQTQLAIAEADLCVLVVDADVGLTPGDREVAQILRRAGKLEVAVANKIDVAAHETRTAEVHELGVDQVFAMSAEHSRGLGPFLDFLVQRLEAPPAEEVEVDQGPISVEESAAEDAEDAPPSRIEWTGGPIRIAVIGRPNAGKSSLINRLLGEDRLLATPVAGTTRDAVDITIEHQGQTFVFVDTAGMRRKRSIDEKIEQWAVSAAVRSLDSADVALVVVDGSVRPADQDAKIASLAHERGKGLILVANKWDLATNADWKKGFEESVRMEMPFAPYAPLLKVSAKTGKATEKIYEAVRDAQRERHRRVTTGELNRFFREKIESFPPPVQNGRRARLYFVSQPLVRPPTFVFTASRPDDLHFSYVRYLNNALRDRYGFKGTPIWLKFRRQRDKR